MESQLTQSARTPTAARIRRMSTSYEEFLKGLLHHIDAMPVAAIAAKPAAAESALKACQFASHLIHDTLVTQASGTIFKEVHEKLVKKMGELDEILEGMFAALSG